MCLSLFLYDAHPALLLLLTFNRDEFWDRPTQPAHFWPDEPLVLAGRDGLRNGTWLGMTRHGRFALLTNFREPMNKAAPGEFAKTTSAPSRGALTTNFLTGTMTPLEYLQALDSESYYGYNLLVGDLGQGQVAYGSNRAPHGPRVLEPGVYGIGNGLLQQWPKVQRGLAALEKCLGLPGCAAGGATPESSQSQPAGPGAPAGGGAEPPSEGQSGAASSSSGGGGEDGCEEGEGGGGGGGLPWGALFRAVMGDPRPVAEGEPLPLTGVGEDLDRKLSSIFIEPFEMQAGTKYGTRSQTVLAVWRDGRVEQRERYIEQVDGEQDSWEWKEVAHAFQLAAEPQQQQQQQCQRRRQQQEQQDGGSCGA